MPRSHYGLPLSKGVVADCSLSCPFHGAQFDLRTGDIEDGPSFDKLPTFPATVDEEGYVCVDLPSEGEVPLSVKPSYCHPSPADARHFVIVGAGAASHAAVEELRVRGFEGRITVLSKEASAHHYDRTVLSKNMAAAADSAKISLRSESWWGDRGVELRLGSTVTKLDADAKLVTLDDGSSLSYDAAMCATSGRARTFREDRSEGFSIAGAQLGGVYTCRDPADATAISGAVRSKPGADVVVLGSSFIGMEAAAYLASSCKLGTPDATVGSITVVGMEAEPFERILGPELGGAMRALHEAQGVTFRLGTSLTSFNAREGDAAAVGSVTLKDGSSLPADVVIIGAGIIPEVGYLHGEGVEVLPRGGGVKVDDRLRAADGLYVCGDIARFPYAHAVHDSHRELRVEHWDVAIAHGRTAARNMLGSDEAFDRVPFFWSGQLGKNIRYAGNAMEWDETLVQGDLAEPKATVFYACGDKVSGRHSPPPPASPRNHALRKPPPATSPLPPPHPSPADRRRGDAAGRPAGGGGPRADAHGQDALDRRGQGLGPVRPCRPTPRGAMSAGRPAPTGKGLRKRCVPHSVGAAGITAVCPPLLPSGRDWTRVTALNPSISAQAQDYNGLSAASSKLGPAGEAAARAGQIRTHAGGSSTRTTVGTASAPWAKNVSLHRARARLPCGCPSCLPQQRSGPRRGCRRPAGARSPTLEAQSAAFPAPTWSRTAHSPMAWSWCARSTRWVPKSSSSGTPQ